MASVDPLSGPAGTEAVVTVSDFFPGIELEVREGSIYGPTLGTAQADGTTGDAAIPITIPVGALGAILALRRPRISDSLTGPSARPPPTDI